MKYFVLIIALFFATPSSTDELRESVDEFNALFEYSTDDHNQCVASPESLLEPVLSCLYGLSAGVVHGGKDFAVGIWSLLKGVIKISYRIARTDIKIMQAIYSEEARKELAEIGEKQRKTVLNIVNVVKKAIPFFHTYLTREVEQYRSFSREAKSRYLCHFIARMGFEVATMVGGVGVLAAKAGKVASLMKVKKIIESSKNLTSAMKAGKNAATSTGDAINNKERIARALKLLHTNKITPKQKGAIIRAHNIGKGEIGSDGITAARIGNYTGRQLRQKAQILKNAGFDRSQRNLMIRHGIVGSNRSVIMQSGHSSVSGTVAEELLNDPNILGLSDLQKTAEKIIQRYLATTKNGPDRAALQEGLDFVRSGKYSSGDAFRDGISRAMGIELRREGKFFIARPHYRSGGNPREVAYEFLNSPGLESLADQVNVAKKTIQKYLAISENGANREALQKGLDFINRGKYDSGDAFRDGISRAMEIKLKREGKLFIARPARPHYHSGGNPSKVAHEFLNSPGLESLADQVNAAEKTIQKYLTISGNGANREALQKGLDFINHGKYSSGPTFIKGISDAMQIKITRTGNQWSVIPAK